MLGGAVGQVTARSQVYETAPWGVLEQPSYLNQVVEIYTAHAPEEVLRLILDIEHELGRVRYERWGARVIDIDILFFGDLVIDSARLTVPHPRLHERRFTLIPLQELVPHYIHPIFTKSVSNLLSECPDESDVHIYSSNNSIID